MAEPTVIGRSTFVRGRIQGSGDLEIAGRIEGEVAVPGGEVLVDTTGLVAADVSARRIVVRGAVRGNLTADEAVVLESGARVVGDLRAPRIAVAPGGLVRGLVQTSGNAANARPAASRAAATIPSRTTAPARAAATPARSVPPPPRNATPAPSIVNVRDTGREARDRDERSRASAPTTPTKPVPAAPPPPSTVVPATTRPASSTSNGSSSRAPATSASGSTSSSGARSTGAGSSPLASRPGPPPPVVPVLKKGTKAVQKKR